MPFDTPLPAISLAVVGIEFDNADGSNRRFALSLCDPGDPIELRREPKNPADEHAVAVHSANGMQLGYIASIRAARISPLLKDGREVNAVFQRRTHFGAWIRVAFDGEQPKLTPEMVREQDAPSRRRQDTEPDFYPDEIWPDD